MTHSDKIKLYIKLGGDPNKVKSLTIENLQNRAALAYLMDQIKIVQVSSEPEALSVPAVIKSEVKIPAARKTKWNDLISQYPVSLHETYNSRYKYWLESCSLKIQLNNVPEGNQKEAYRIQSEILKNIHKMDQCQAALDYYNETKSVLPTESSREFTGVPKDKLIMLRNNLRSNISQRKNTLKKKQSSLPDVGSPNYLSRLNMLQQKVEELKSKELDLEKIENLLVE